MTDPSSASWRRRRRGGRHQGTRRRPESSPLAPDAARRAREAAFGNRSSARTWIGTPTTEPADSPAKPPSSSSADTGHVGSGRADTDQTEESPGGPEPSASPPSRGEEQTAPPGGTRPRGRRAAHPASAWRTRGPATEEQDVWSVDEQPPAASGAADPRSASEPSAAPGSAVVPGRARAASASAGSPPERSSPPAPAARPTQDRTAGRSPASPSPGKRPLRRRPEPEPQGSLPRVALWTVLTSFLPGSGLVTTRLRTVGLVILGVLALLVIAAGAFLLFGDPLRTGMLILTDRTVLVSLMLALGVVGVLWALQILASNLAHSTQQRLAGAKRYIALGVAALMVVAVALPFGRGVQSLWAAQGLLGSDTVFGIGRDGSRLSGGEDPWAGVGRMNVLMLGQDAGEDRTGTRPDTIMVASIDTESGRTALFSIPRNLENVQFPEDTVAGEQFPDGFDYFGGQQDLINAVWTWAEDRPDLFPNDPEPGLTATTWAVEETLGLEIDHYAMVNLQGFEDLVDALGGVEMVVERRIPIGGGSGPISGYIESGEQTLDGYHALWYARSREGSDDFDRMCRQQRIVRAVTEEADPGTLAMSVPGLVTATEENIVTDIPAEELDAYVDLALRVKDAGVTSYPITQEVTPSHDADWDYLKAWTDASIEDSMQREDPDSVTGETEGGTDEPAATGEAPEGAEDPGDGEGAGEDGTPTPEETAEEETPTDETASPTDGEGGGEPTADDPEIEQDPLQSCLPGAEQG